MSIRLISDEEVLALQASPYVESVSRRSVMFTPEFKQIAYEQLSAGKTMYDIMEAHGINTAALGRSRVNGFRQKLCNAAEREAGFANLRKQRKRTEPADGDKLERRVRQLEHQLAYAKQEVEFLKKIQQADTEARKQWESAHRHK